MAESDRTCKFSKVYDEEIKEEIIPRRKAAGVDRPAATDQAKRTQTRESLVGLALSGGGIRAAAFGLGVLQVLHRNKLMRHVDYLSTVSGGGYSGSLFSSLVNHPVGSVVWKDNQISNSGELAAQALEADKAPSGIVHPTFAESPYTIESGADGKQPPLVRSLSTSGPVLRRPVTFASAYFFGLLLTNLVAVSGLLAAGALFAFLFQVLSEPRVSTFISALGFNNDVRQAFFPAFVLTLLWVICMLVGYAVQPLEFLVRAARGLFVMLVASLAMGVVALIGSGNIDMRAIGQSVGVPTDNGLVPGSAGGRVISVIVLIIALMPYLRVKELVRSGVRPRDFKDRWIFAIASRALLYGVPLLVFGYFVGENFSEFNDQREILVNDLKFSKSNMLYPSFFGSEWDKFWQTVETSAKSQANNPDTSKTLEDGVDNFASLRSQVDRCLWQIANGNPPASDNGTSGQYSISDARTCEFKLLWPHDPATTEQNSKWSWPTSDDDHRQAATKTPASRASKDLSGKESESQKLDDQPSIVDMEQDLQGDLEDYDKRYMLDKWSLLPSLPWPKSNELANQFDQNMKQRERDSAICDRINYQFLSNAFVAAAILKQLTPVVTVNDDAGGKENANPAHSVTSGTKVDGKAPTPPVKPNHKLPQQARDIIAKLDRSPSGMPVRYLSDLIEPDLVTYLKKIKLALKSEEQRFLAEFLEWQRLKHQILYHEQNGWPDERTTRKTLIQDIGKQFNEKKASHRQRDFEAIEAGIREFNLAGLEQLLYPGSLQSQETVFSTVVLAEDQRARLRFFAWAALTCLIASLLVNLNFTSIHSYYQQLMAKVWIVERPGNENRLPLVQLNNTSVGAPYHLLHGTVSLTPRGRFKPDFPRGGFLFSKRYCGGFDRGYLATSELRNLDLATAMSVSGAAITPSAVDNQLVWAIMFVCNLRTGQWLAWPSAVTTRLANGLYRFARWMPGMAWHVALNACLPPSWRTMTFVYDGGLYENLGVEPLLARRCRMIIAVDAGEDGESRFADFQLLVQRCRSRYGVTIEEIKPQDQAQREDLWMARVSPKWTKTNGDPLKRTFDERLAERGVMLFRITYPTRSGLNLPPLDKEKHEGTLVYIKPTLTKTAYPDVLGYAQGETEFPQDATLNQFYQPRQFDAYRALGVSLGEEALKELESRAGDLPGVERYWKPLCEASPGGAGERQAGERRAGAGPGAGEVMAKDDAATRAADQSKLGSDEVTEHWLDEVIRDAMRTGDPTRDARHILLAVASALHRPRRASRFLPTIRRAIEESVGQKPESRAQFVRRALARYIQGENT